MKEAKKTMIRYAMAAIFVLLTVLLAIINIVDFGMAADDADRITESLAIGKGEFRDTYGSGYEREAPEHFGPMGPFSPEMEESLRFFTVKINDEGEASVVVHEISAVSKKEAVEWAESLQKEETGWTKGTYRYRVFHTEKNTYVTVIDQGRELLPCYRILMISVLGEILCLVIAAVLLNTIGEKMMHPLEEAKRRQKRFISDIEKDFNEPLSVIEESTEQIERDGGAGDATRTIRQQVKKMNGLLKDLTNIPLMEKEAAVAKVDLSAICEDILANEKHTFDEKNIPMNVSIEKEVTIKGSEGGLKRAITEIVENAARFTTGEVVFNLKKEGSHSVIEVINATEESDRDGADLFDRFTRLESAKSLPGAGIGLNTVREIVKAHNGRATAKIENGKFILRIVL